MPKIKQDSAKKNLKSSRSCGNVLNTSKSTHNNVNGHHSKASESNVKNTSTKRKSKSLESMHQNASGFLGESPNKLMKATSVKRMKISKSPSSNVITRSKSKILTINEVSSDMEITIEITNDQVIASVSKDEIPNLIPKRYCSSVYSESESSSEVDGSLIQVKEPETSKLPVAKSSRSKIKTPKSVVPNESVNETFDNLKSTEREKILFSVLTDPMQVPFEKNIQKRDQIDLISDNKSEFREVHKFETHSRDSTVKFEKTNYEDLLALNDVNLVRNIEKFKCPICFLDVDVGEGATLQECLHSFCRICLTDAIQISETAVVKCPFQNNEYSCECYLQEREIKSLVEPEVYELHLQRSVAFAESQAQNSFHCKTLYCPGWCLIEDAVNVFLCPVCNHVNCLTCAAIHEGRNCNQYDQISTSNNVEQAGKTSEYLQSEFFKVPDFATCSRDLEVKVEKTDYHNLLALNDINLVQNTEQFDCPICFSDVNVGEGATLQECLHSFCRECLAGAIQFSETAVVKCPFRNDEYSCESYLQEREVKSLVSSEVYEKHLQRSVALAENQAQNSFHCKTPDCSGWCLFEDDVNMFVCPVCCHANCLTCAAIHEGKNCKQYQDDLVFKCDSVEEARKTTEYLQNIVNNGKAMRCPQCQIIVMKKSGCDWIKCSMCHTEICWRTKGPRWGPKGLGDTSGGCKCMLNGKRCHPHCNNCH